MALGKLFRDLGGDIAGVVVAANRPHGAAMAVNPLPQGLAQVLLACAGPEVAEVGAK